HGIAPVEVLFGQGLADGFAERLERAVTPKTSAIYVATPNNPDGVMLGAADIDAIARVADKHGLWILADEVYEDYGYDAPHISIATHPAARPRTVTVFSVAEGRA